MKSPTQLRLWSKGDDPSEDKPALTLEFKVTEKVTTIVLNDMGNAKIDEKWFEGNWNRVDSNNPSHDLRIEIIDDTHCNYNYNYYNKESPTVTNTTYISDKAEGSIEIDMYMDLGKVTFHGYGKDEGDYGTDYIRASYGERYLRVK